MNNFTPAQLERFVLDTIDHASAPVGSAKYGGTPQVIASLVERGEPRDVWVYLSALVSTIIESLKASHSGCTCGNPDHQPTLVFGTAPVLPNGKPDMDQWNLTTADDIPAAAAEGHPEVFAFAQFMKAQLSQDLDRALEIWNEASDHGYLMKLIYIVMRQAGDVRRRVAANQGLN